MHVIHGFYMPSLTLAHSACSSDQTKTITRKPGCKVVQVEIRIHAHALVLGGISRGAEGPPLGLRDPSRPSPKPEPWDGGRSAWLGLRHSIFSTLTSFSISL
jgi:hypothetical protein